MELVKDNQSLESLKKAFANALQNQTKTKFCLSVAQTGTKKLDSIFALLKTEQDAKRLQALLEADSLEVDLCHKAFSVGGDIAKTKRSANWLESANSGTASISVIRKYRGEDTAIAYLQAMLASVASKFGKRNDVTPVGLNEMATDILTSYYFLTVDDVSQLCRHLLTKLANAYSVDYARMYAAIIEILESRIDTIIAHKDQLHQIAKQNWLQQVSAGDQKLSVQVLKVATSVKLEQSK